ncbi:response regulator, partial [Campylobacter coli]
LNHEVDIVFSLAEVKALPNDEYFLTFADLCLPDAPNGEVVDYILAKNWPVIVSVSYTHLRAHETPEHLVCRLLLEKKKK